MVKSLWKVQDFKEIMYSTLDLIFTDKTSQMLYFLANCIAHRNFVNIVYQHQDKKNMFHEGYVYWTFAINNQSVIVKCELNI